MTGKGALSIAPQRRMRWMLLIHLLWTALLMGIVLWWRSILLSQAETISQLEERFSIAEGSRAFIVTQRMLWWESTTATVILLSLSGLIFWLYWRDSKRARSLQAFFASVTHELRTPLTSIRLQAESIADAAESSEQGTQALVARLLEDTQRLESQVERVLELSRVEGGGPVHLQAVDLKPWLNRLTQTTTEAYAGRVRIHSEQTSSLAVEVDPAALQLIVRNLMENSVRHSGCDPVEIYISAAAGLNGRVVLALSDNGRGYSGNESLLGTLFHRGSASNGAGVGLYLIRVLMERMGGRAEFLNGARGFEARLEFSEARNHE
jgi:signal transduction histidine kinase